MHPRSAVRRPDYLSGRSIAIGYELHKAPNYRIGIRLKRNCKTGGVDPLKFAGVQVVFIDRDGILNRKLPEGRFVVRCQDLELMFGAADAVAKLNEDGRRVIVVTNQR